MEEFRTNWDYGYSALFVIIAILTMIGNAMVIGTVVARKPMRPSLNCLIVSISIADILFAILFLLPSPFTILDINWPMGDFGCKLSYFSYETTTAVVPITLIALSIVLFKLIMFPTQKSLTNRESILIAISIWTICCIIGLPGWLDTKVYDFPTVHICLNPMYFKETESFYFPYYNLLKFFVPGIWLTMAYAIILYRSSQPYNLVGHRKKFDIDDFNVNKQMVKMMAVTSAVYLIGWIWLTFDLVCDRIFGGDLEYTNLRPKLLIGVISGMARPGIYIVMSGAKFRSQIWETICCRHNQNEIPNTELI